MFGNNKNTTKPGTVSTDNFSANTIQNGTEIEGKISSHGSIRIDGKLIGSIATKAKLVVGKTGVILGDIFCQNASIEGRVEGKINVQGLLDLKSTGVIAGDIVTNKLVLEEGARFDGKCSMGSSTQKARISEKQTFTHKKAV
jgi:cytoskeletal protein CcmA (bactofilin family)